MNKQVKKILKPTSLTSAVLLALVGCQGTNEVIAQPASTTIFTPADNAFKYSNKNLRKWDVATVADLDQNGYPDLLLNDHGFSVKILWNNQGKFAKPYDLIMGDVHGLTAADFDKNGSIDLVISRGGGSGSNARNSKVVSFDKKRSISQFGEFATPLAMMRGRTVKWVDLNQDGWLDLINFAFPSREMKGKSENYLYLNSQDGQLVEKARLPAIHGDGQKTLVTDFNNDGLPDLLIYGTGPLKAYQANGAFNYEDVTKTVLPTTVRHTTSVSEIDYDNDGDFDLLITRGEEFKAGDTFYNPQKQALGFYWKRGAHKFPPFYAGDVIHFENLQSQWPTKDLLIGESAYKYEFPGETHSGRDIRLVNSDALGFPDKLTEKGTYIGYIGNGQWQLAGNMWSPMTGVITGVSGFSEQTEVSKMPDLLLENRNGKFVNVTNKVGLSHHSHTTSSAVADFNNDGYQDIAIIQRGNLVDENSALIYLNQQGQSFAKKQAHGVVTKEYGAIGLGIEPVDYNLDGQVDLLIGHERGKWHLFDNQQADSNYIQVKVPSSIKSNVSALGAVVKVQACENSQMQRVGATSAAYSQSFNPVVHFGLANCNETVKVQVTWSNGEHLTESVNSINRTVKL
ncbi:hypothetical protein DS2_12153 [Catenovulum agarivorans DS-2]|uniref:ASPIC/UnbV domain-containing protein n=1 Tax=Catenovulum agarivorans DS-2 TaxID=1328313 RepID=W7Q9X4_9ALTE|nr:CRTAC1 family protein [Catenovulum agarivorans]EWH09584.1 hypothetical protein DS2_12153 [Catenovulum agarivorans DS-2]